MRPTDLASELATAAWGMDEPAFAAWLEIALRQDRAAAWERLNAAWDLLPEAPKAALYTEVVEGVAGHLETMDERVPYPLVSDLAELWARTQHLASGR